MLGVSAFPLPGAHEAKDCFVNLIELPSSTGVERGNRALESFEPARDLDVCVMRLLQFHERPDHINAHLYGTFTVENRCRHDRAMLGKDQRCLAPAAVLRRAQT